MTTLGLIKKAGPILLGTSLAAFGLLSALGDHGSSQERLPSFITPGVGPPFPGAVSVADMKSAESMVGRHILRPSSCPANDQNISKIEVNPDTGQVFLEYQDVSASGTSCDGFGTGQVQVMEFMANDVVSGAGSPTPSSANQRPSSAAGQLDVTPSSSPMDTPSPLDQQQINSEMQARANALGGIAHTEMVAGVTAIVLQGNYSGDCFASSAPGQQGCAPAQQNNAAVIMQVGPVVVQVLAPSDWSSSEVVSVANTVV